MHGRIWLDFCYSYYLNVLLSLQNKTLMGNGIIKFTLKSLILECGSKKYRVTIQEIYSWRSFSLTTITPKTYCRPSIVNHPGQSHPIQTLKRGPVKRIISIVQMFYRKIMHTNKISSNQEMCENTTKQRLLLNSTQYNTENRIYINMHENSQIIKFLFLNKCSYIWVRIWYKYSSFTVINHCTWSASETALNRSRAVISADGRVDFRFAE